MDTKFDIFTVFSIQIKWKQFEFSIIYNCQNEL